MIDCNMRVEYAEDVELTLELTMELRSWRKVRDALAKGEEDQFYPVGHARLAINKAVALVEERWNVDVEADE